MRITSGHSAGLLRLPLLAVLGLGAVSCAADQALRYPACHTNQASAVK